LVFYGWPHHLHASLSIWLSSSSGVQLPTRSLVGNVVGATGGLGAGGLGAGMTGGEVGVVPGVWLGLGDGDGDGLGLGSGL
jgi:uncharacterized membrane protein